MNKVIIIIIIIITGLFTSHTVSSFSLPRSLSYIYHSILSFAILHLHFVIHIFSMRFYHSHFVICISSSALFHPPYAAIRSTLDSDSGDVEDFVRHLNQYGNIIAVYRHFTFGYLQSHPVTWV